MTRTTLEIGASGADVETLQRFLNWHGYDLGTVTGYYDESTANAVKAFQVAKGLDPTGVADEAVWDLVDHGGVAPEDRYFRIVSADLVSFSGTQLHYTAFNEGSIPALAGFHDDVKVWWWSGTAAEHEIAIPSPVFTYGADIPAETSYTGTFDLGALEMGGYYASIRLNARQHEVLPEAIDATQSMQLIFRVMEDGAEPLFSRWA